MRSLRVQNAVVVCAVLASLLSSGCATTRQAPNLGEATSASQSQQAVGDVRPTTGLAACSDFAAPGAVMSAWDALEFQCLSDGSVVRGSQLRGKPTVAIVWASWCGPCRKELPLLAEFAKTQSRVRVLGIGWKDQPSALQAYARDAQLPFATVVDRDAAIGAALNINSQPTLVLIDSSGSVTHIRRAPIESVQALALLVSEYL